MNISLRKAAKIRNRIEGVLASLETELSLPTIDINIFDADAIDQIHAASATLKSATARFSGLVEVYYAIRDRIAGANSAAGVDSLLGQRASLMRVKKVMDQLSGQPASDVTGTGRRARRLSFNYDTTPASGEVMPTDDQIQGRLSALVAIAKAGQSSVERSLSFSILPKEIKESAIETRKEIAQKLDDIQDKIELLNGSTSIELTDVEISLLNSENIVI